MTKDKRDIERLKNELANTQKVEAWQHAEAEKYSRQAEALQVQLDAAAEVLQVFAQFAKMKGDESGDVTIRVPVSAVREARRLLGGAFRDYSSTEDIPV